MKKTNYEQGQIPTVGDMNDQHILTQDAFGVMVEAVTGGLAEVLLTNRIPVVTESGANWAVDVPEQTAAVVGRPFKTEQTVLAVPIADNQIGVWLILKEVDVNETRERLRLSGSTPVRENFSPVVRKEEVSRVAYTNSTSPTIEPPLPSLSPDDVGFIKLATIESSLTGPTSNVIPNTIQLWSFPGGGLAVGLHALTHMPGGTDPIPLAQIGGPQGSSAGIMPDTSLLFAMESLQDVRVASSTPYLTATDNVSQSTLSTPKFVTLEMRLHSSLEVKDDGGVSRLGVRFATGPYAGQSGVAPNSDHTHSLSESPITVDYARVDITTAEQLGSIITLPPFGTLSDLYAIELLWSPTGFNVAVPGIECGWVQTSTGFIGVRAHKSASNQITLEIGREGITRFQDSVREWIIDQYTDAQTWNSQTADGNTPSNGIIHVKVVGIRT